MTEENKIKVYERIGEQYKEVSLEYFYGLELKVILSKDMILQLNDCFFCSNNDTIQKYIKNGREAKHFNAVFDVYRSKLLAVGMSEVQDILDWTLFYLRTLLSTTKIMDATIEKEKFDTSSFTPVQNLNTEKIEDNKGKLCWPTS